MKIYYHKLKASAQSITVADVEHIAALACVPMHLFDTYTTLGGAQVFTWKSPQGDGAESIRISIPATALYGSIVLNGSFWNVRPDFPMHELYVWIRSKGGNVKLSDISFEDDQNLLDFKEIRNMCSLDNYKDFLTGTCTNSRKSKSKEYPDSTNRCGCPDVHQNHDLIHLGNVGSPLSAKAYVMANGNVKFELTVDDKQYNRTIFEMYSPDTIEDWETLAKQALIKCVNFVKPSSKKARRGLVQIDSWRNFLGSETAPIRWAEHQPIVDVSEVSFSQQLSRNIAQIQNMCHKHRIYDDVAENIKSLQEQLQSAYDSLRQLEQQFTPLIL